MGGRPLGFVGLRGATVLLHWLANDARSSPAAIWVESPISRDRVQNPGQHGRRPVSSMAVPGAVS